MGNTLSSDSTSSSSANSRRTSQEFFPAAAAAQSDTPILEHELPGLPFFIDTATSENADEARRHVEATLIKAKFGAYAFSQASNGEYRFSVRVIPTQDNGLAQVKHHLVAVRANTITLKTDDNDAAAESSTYPSLASFREMLAAKDDYKHFKLDPLNPDALITTWSIEDLAQRVFGESFKRTHINNDRGSTGELLAGQPVGTALLRPSSQLIGTYVFGFVGRGDKVRQYRFILCPTEGYIFGMANKKIEDLPYIGEPPETFRSTASAERFAGATISESSGGGVDSTDPISFELVAAPVITPCGHIFEKDSLDKHIQRQVDEHLQPNCPCCRNTRVVEYEGADKSAQMQRLVGEAQQWRLANVDENALATINTEKFTRYRTFESFLAELKEESLPQGTDFSYLEDDVRKVVTMATYDDS